MARAIGKWHWLSGSEFVSLGGLSPQGLRVVLECPCDHLRSARCQFQATKFGTPSRVENVAVEHGGFEPPTLPCPPAEWSSFFLLRQRRCPSHQQQDYSMRCAPPPGRAPCSRRGRMARQRRRDRAPPSLGSCSAYAVRVVSPSRRPTSTASCRRARAASWSPWWKARIPAPAGTWVRAMVGAGHGNTGAPSSQRRPSVQWSCAYQLRTGIASGL
jgi:hypothetical protein